MLDPVRSMGFGIPNPGFGIPTPGFGIPNPGFGIPNPEFEIPNPGCGIPNPRFGIPNPGFGIIASQKNQKKCFSSVMVFGGDGGESLSNVISKSRTSLGEHIERLLGAGR